MKLVFLVICAMIWSLSCNKNVEESKSGGSSIQASGLTMQRANERRNKEEIELFDGECISEIEYFYEKDGKLKDVKIKSKHVKGLTGNCQDVKLEKDKIKYNGWVVTDNPGWLTFAPDPSEPGPRNHGPMKCYGPPVPSPPRCVCLHSPCPPQ